MNAIICQLKARFKYDRFFHAPDLLLLSSTLKRLWSGVKSDVEFDVSLQMYTTS